MSASDRIYERFLDGTLADKNVTEICKILSMPYRERNRLIPLLDELCADGKLFKNEQGRYGTAEQLGLYTIQWDVDSLDWKDLSASEIANRVISRVKNGSIVLFHNQGLHTHESLRNIIRTLKSKGYSFLPIGKMIYKKDYKILPDGTQTINV